MSKQKRKNTVLKDDNNEEDTDATPQKKAKDPVTIISEIDFKFLLRDDETVPEGLQNFVDTSESFSDGYPCTDIIVNYCKSSPNLAELWSLIEPTGCKLKENGVALVFQCLEQILTRIRNDLFKLSSVGEAIVQKVLAVHMGQVYNCLRFNNKSKIMKAAIDLLIAMVMLSDKSKRAVLTRLNFGHAHFPLLFQRRNRQDPRDPRNCLVLLTLAFLLDSDDAVINIMVQQKTFIQLTIGGLVFDSKEVVVDTLATLMDKVVKCPGVSKTDRVKLFSEAVLRQICELFQWKGPSGWTGYLKKKKEKKDEVQVEDVNEDDRQAVAEVAYNFLTELCCSHKFGVNFFDKSVGTGNSNKNPMLSHFLEWLTKKIDEPQVSELIISTLCESPDQIKLVLNSLSPLFFPRWSEKWSKLMDWLAKLYSSLPERLQFLEQADLLRDANNLVTMAAVFCLPPPKVSIILHEGIKHDDVRVRHKTLQVMMALVLKASGIKKELTQRLCVGKNSMLGETVLDLFTANVLMILPSLSNIFGCVDKVMQQLSQKDKKDVEVKADLYEHAAVILQVLTLYQNFTPTLISERPKDLAKLIEMVGQVADDHPKAEEDEDGVHMVKEQAVVPELCLLKLLSEIDAKSLPLGREGILLKLLTFASHCGQYRSICVELTCKMLQTVEVFSNHGKELCVWIETALKSSFTACLLNSTPRKDHVINFLAKSLSALINNPAPYVDRILEKMTGLGPGDEESVDTEKHKFTDILAMDLNELEQQIEAFQPSAFHRNSQGLDLPLSPLTLVALENLERNIAAVDGIQTYVSLVLTQLVYTVRTPQILARLVLQSKVIFDKHVTGYITYWQSKKKKPSKVKPLPAETFGKCTNVLMAVFFGHCKLEDPADRENAVGQLTTELGLLDPDAKVKVLRQVMFYLSEIATRIQDENGYILDVLTSVAEVLIDELASSEKWAKEESMLTDDMSSNSGRKENQSLASTSELEVDKLRFTYSDIFTSLNSGVNQFKEGVLNVLQNPTINNLVFVKEKRKSKERGSSSLTVSLATFMKNVLNKCKDWAWFKYERDVVQILVSELMAALMLTGKTQHLSELETIYLDMLTIVYPILDLVLLSKCITQMLELQEDAFFVENRETSTKRTELRQTFKVLCLLLQRWVLLIQEDPSFISANVFPQTQQKPWGKEVAAEKSNAMRITFSIEESCLQPPARFAKMFDLLPDSENADFLSIVLFAVSHLPEVARHLTVGFFGELFKMQMDMKGGSLSEQIVSRVLGSSEDFFIQCGVWMDGNARKLFKRRKWNLIASYLSAASKFTSQITEVITAVVEELKKAAVKHLKTAGAENASKELLHVYQQLSSIVKYSDVEFHQLLVSAMKESIKSQDVPDQQLQFELLVASLKFSHLSTEQGRESSSVVVELALRYLSYLTSSKTTRHTEMETYILDTLPQLISAIDHRSISFLSSLWEKLVTNTLRHMYMNSKLLNLLCKLVPFVYSSTSSAKPSTLSALTMFQMCVNHTAFIQVIMDPEHIAAKDGLVQLLYLLGDLQPTAHEPHLFKVFVGSYTATLSETDQRLLLMMQKCQKDTSKKFECPSVWGKTAVEHYSVSKVLGPSLDKEASVKSILEQLDQQRMQDSVLNFPLRRSQQCASVKHSSEFKSKPSCYDPNFLLPLFVQVLSPDKLVPLRLFVERGCLSYLLVALSSHDTQSRLLAYQALNDFYLHAEGSRWQERTEVNFLLDLLNSSRDKDGEKLSFILALFFARVVKILMYPGDALYVPIFKFLLAKPEIDLNNIPEFYQLFFSSSVQFKQERNWLLSLLCDGLRETSDYRVYQKKHVFKIIMCFYSSSLSDNKSKELILQTLKNACKEKFIAVDLVRKHGLIPWLLTVAKDLPSSPENTNLVCELVHTLWISLTTMRYKSLPQKIATGTAKRKSDQPHEGVGDKTVEAIMDVDEGDNKLEGETGGATDLTSAVSVNEESLPVLSPASVPPSTKVEIGLIVKCLIWNLWNAYYENLVNMMEIIRSLLSAETGLSQGHNSATEGTVRTDMHKQQEPEKTGHCINLSTVEALLLLYHGSNILHLDRIAEKARELLNRKGVSPDSLVSKSATQSQHRATKGYHSKSDDAAEEGDADTNKSFVKVTEGASKVETEAGGRLIFTRVEQQRLMHLVYTLSNLTDTLTFV